MLGFKIGQSLYARVYAHYEGDHFRLYTETYGLVSAVVVLFWCGLFSYVDVFQKPRWFLRYKVQPGKHQPLAPALWWRIFRVTLFNMVVVGGAANVLLYALGERLGGDTYSPATFPALWVVLRDIGVSLVVQEVLFYYAHRLAHWGPFYRHVHKKHHELQAPVSVSFAYCHPLEQLVVNIPAFTFGPLLMRSHLWTRWLWVVISLTDTTVCHSGYHLPVMDSPEFHDYHHLKYNVNYGGSALCWMDRLHGTDAAYQGTDQSRRHCRFFSLTRTIRDYYPDTTDQSKGASSAGKKDN